MRSLMILTVLLALTMAPTLDAQECPCVPIAQTWTVTACPTWNCAVSEMVLANGATPVMTMPSNSPDHKWLVLRRVSSGSYTESPDAPFTIETFESFSAASARFSAIAEKLHPMLVTTTDARTLVVSLRAQDEVAGRRRATAP